MYERQLLTLPLAAADATELHLKDITSFTIIFTNTNSYKKYKEVKANTSKIYIFAESPVITGTGERVHRPLLEKTPRYHIRLDILEDLS